MKITDPKLLHELYEIEAERKLLIGYRFKGSSGAATKPSVRRLGKKRVSAGSSKIPTAKR
jgi:hypothetical protein